jgi:hypothetical protein
VKHTQPVARFNLGFTTAAATTGSQNAGQQQYSQDFQICITNLLCP